MTPEREKYLAKCGKREKFLRAKIKDEKKTIRANKYAIQTLPRIPNLDLKQASKWVCNYKRNIAEALLMLSYYRHELNRFKCMDRVVVPREVEIHLKIVGMGMVNVATGICKCGEKLESLGHVHCPVCGRRILWEKVK